MTPTDPARDPLGDDALLRDVPVVDGRKVLPPAVLLARLGRGGMGTVYRGWHTRLRIEVAIKCLEPTLIERFEHAQARFEREARIAARLSHQNLVRLYELRRAHGLSYLILEYVDGETAQERVQRKGPLAEDDAARIVFYAARGLAVAHRHEEVVVHRDIKPANILISKRGEVKLADLGLAKTLGRADTATFVTGGLLGTPLFMAPEQWDETREITPRTDVWALGATLFFLLTGRAPAFGARVEGAEGGMAEAAATGALASLSPELARILERATHRDPARRHADAGELASDLGGFLRRRTAETEWLPGRAEPARRGWRRPAFAATALVAFGAAGGWWWNRGDARGERANAAGPGVGPRLPATPGERDEGSGSLKPPGWEVVDGTPGLEGWARSVREPQSGIVFLLVEPDVFLMGSPRDEEGRDDDCEVRHEVRISRPFYLAETETTVGQWCAALRLDTSGYEELDLPRCGLTWDQAHDFCTRIDCTLPTEAQWEFAARAGTTTRFWFGDAPGDAEGKGNFLDVSWRRGKSGPKVPREFEFDDRFRDEAPVRRFLPNANGFYDMAGNASEWCLDSFRCDYEHLPAVDPFCYEVGSYRVLRGGSWESDAKHCRSAARWVKKLGEVYKTYGFRAARNL